MDCHVPMEMSGCGLHDVIVLPWVFFGFDYLVLDFILIFSFSFEGLNPFSL